MFLGCAYASDDPQESFRWFLKAAKLGEPEAQLHVGASFLEGRGVAHDASAAVHWLRRSANQGHPHGQGMLAVCYAEGNGVPQNRVFAYMWLNLSLAQSWRHLDYWQETLDLSRKSRDELAAAMTGEELAEAQRLSAVFVPKMEVEPTADAFRIPRIALGPTDGLIAAGSGFFLTSDGYLITSHHVLEAASYIVVQTKTEKLVAKLVQSDPANDLALLKVSGQFTPLGVTTSRGVKLGQSVLTVGFPNIGLQGFSPKLAKGEIASLSGAADDPRYFQISVPVQPGNSGGALVDERGNVVGVVSAKLDAATALQATGALPENVNYAIKSSFLLGFLESVPEVSAKLKAPNTSEMEFEDVVKTAERPAVPVLVY